jgi:hypothetical protein
LQNCKKAKTPKNDLLKLKNDITIQIESLELKDTLQISAIGLISDKLELSKVFNGSETFGTLQLSVIRASLP